MDDFQTPQKEQSIASLFSSYKVDTRNIRQRFTDEAVDRINKDREGTKWNPVTKRTVAIRINFVCPKGHDNFVHDFQKQCQQAKNYSKCFWGASKMSL